MNIHKILSVIIKPFRLRRMNNFMARMAPAPGEVILDIGGSEYNWDIIDYSGAVTLLNIREPKQKNLKYNYVIGDATNLSYEDNEFPIVYSNSVIEHLSTYENQEKFANEMRRTGITLWCQTPAKGFFIEPHYITPFVHFLPKKAQRKLLRNFSVWGLITRPSLEAVNDMVDELRLLTYDEMKQLFPDCEIIKERFLFMTKSYIAVRIEN